MSLREEILAAARRLAGEKPLDQITLSDVARASGVHPSTARRHLGNKADLRAMLAREQAVTGASNPDTRTRILAAASRVFARHGYAGATLDQVAADAGLTKGAVYWHFSSKCDLYLALLQEHVSQQVSELPGEVARYFGTLAPEKALAAWLEAKLAACQEDPGRMALFFEFVASSRDPAVRERLGAIIRAAMGEAADVVRRLQESELLAPDWNPYVLAVFFNAVLNGLSLEWLIDPGNVRPKEWASELAGILWRGIRRAEG